jgi:hypothetical protein
MGSRRARRLRIAAVVAALVLVAGAAATVLMPLPVYVAMDYFDVNGGRVRHVTRILGITVHDETEETRLSATYERLVGPLPAPRWEPDSRHQPGIYIHCVYGGSIATATWLPEVVENPFLSRAAGKEVVETFFRLLREDGRSARATSYAFSLSEFLAKQPDATAPASLGPDDLPAAPETP